MKPLVSQETIDKLKPLVYMKIDIEDRQQAFEEKVARLTAEEKEALDAMLEIRDLVHTTAKTTPLSR